MEEEFNCIHNAHYRAVRVIIRTSNAQSRVWWHTPAVTGPPHSHFFFLHHSLTLLFRRQFLLSWLLFCFYSFVTAPPVVDFLIYISILSSLANYLRPAEVTCL